MRRVYRLIGARQAAYGIETALPNQWETLRESFGEFDLSVEYGRPVEVVDAVSEDATVEARWNLLAGLEDIGGTWAEQEAVREADRVADESD